MSSLSLISNRTILFLVLLANTFFLSAQSITVNSTDYKQTIDMIGGDMERSSKAIQNAKNKQDILQWSFGDINFNVCRVQYDKNQELVEGTKNWAFYDKQVITMQQIKAINPNIKFFATMRSDYDGYGDDNNMPDWIHTYSSKATNTTKYGVFLADYCEYMSQQGVPISILSTAKEWMWHVRAYEADDIINTLKSELSSRGVAMPMIIDQGFWSITAGLTYLRDVDSNNTEDLYTGFCSHNYANEGSDKWVEIIEKADALGKPMYDDETSTGSGSPTYGVERAMFKQIDEYIKKAERYEAGLNGEVFFEIWSRGIDKETRSIYFPSSGTGERLRGYYMMKQFSNNILDHKYITSTINSLDNVWTIAFRKDDKIVLWVINEGGNEYNFPINTGVSTITSQIATHYWTNNTPIEGTTTMHNASGNTFVANVEAESMSCYIFNVTEDAIDACSLSTSTVTEAECYDEMSNITTEANNEGSLSVTKTVDGGWIKFANINFDTNYEQVNFRVASDNANGIVELRTGSVDGNLIGTLQVANTSGLDVWETQSVEISDVSGTQDLYLIFGGGVNNSFSINWMELQESSPSVDLEVSSLNKSVALNWTTENINVASQKIYRNTTFTEVNKTLVADDVSGESYTDTSVENKITYYYWVEIMDTDSNVYTSEIVSVTPSIPNLALASNGCIATQSTTAYNGLPEYAIDGNTDGTYGNGSVSHTAHGTVGDGVLKWWQVDLLQDYTIETVDVYNRTGSNYGDILNNFTVEVINNAGQTTFSQYFQDPPDPLTSVNVGGVEGKIVKISKTSDYGITLAEVEVYGSASSLSTDVFTNEVKVYVQTNKEVLSIENAKGYTLQLFNTLGQQVLQKEIDSDNQSITVSNLINGIYFVKISKGGRQVVKKIVKD